MKSRRLLLFVVFYSVFSFAGTLRVPQDFPTVQGAVAASVTGDTIVVSPGLYAIPASPCTLANGAEANCGLVVHDGTALVGSGPAQTVLDFSAAQIGILLQNGTAMVKLAHLQNAGTALYAYVGSNITATNIIITNANLGMELNQGNSYNIVNTTIDGVHATSQTGSGIDVPFGGAANVQNNLVTHSDRAFTAGSFSFGTYAFNDTFGSAASDWETCTSAGCTPVAAPATNLSFDPLYCPDFSLQTASPARNAGNPAILNPDGTRSDLGAYGGAEAILPATTCPIGFLSFPLPRRTSLTAKINTVFDHSMDYEYCADGTVTAYDGEQGQMSSGASFVVSFRCRLTKKKNKLFGFKQIGGVPFSLNGQYDGGGDATYLNYEGHPGYDYKTIDQDPTGQIPVLAAAAGSVICVNIHTKLRAPCTEGPGEIKLDHGNGYFTIYLHLSAANVGVGDHVTNRQQIGIGGDTGVEGTPHLHFEVRQGVPGSQCLPSTCVPVDPYGWTGAGIDKYMRAVNLNLWR